jgi:hypothetical protein
VFVPCASAMPSHQAMINAANHFLMLRLLKLESTTVRQYTVSGNRVNQENDFALSERRN